MRICICGGGNLGHVCAGFLANRGHQVSLLTTKPERWNQTIEVVAPEGTFRGQLTLVTAKPEEVIPQADIVLICLPGFAIHEELLQIKPFLSENSILFLSYRVPVSSLKPSKFFPPTSHFSGSSVCHSSPESLNMAEK